MEKEPEKENRTNNRETHVTEDGIHVTQYQCPVCRQMVSEKRRYQLTVYQERSKVIEFPPGVQVDMAISCAELMDSAYVMQESIDVETGQVVGSVRVWPRKYSNKVSLSKKLK